MRYFGQTAISDFLGDNVVYRSLVPMDARLPSLDQLRDLLGLPAGTTPRKTSPEYALVISHLLKAARQLSASGAHIERVIFIGDTRLNDSTAFANICRAGNWPGLAFIGAEDSEKPQTDLEDLGVCTVMHANRWSMLAQFQAFCQQRGFMLDATCVVLLDLDKTTLGARGRNDQVINQARVQAASQTVASVLGERFNLETFQTTYDHFNQTQFHPFTTDNQDYLVYITLMIEYGLYTRHGLVCAMENEVITDFDALLTNVDRRSVELPPALKSIHQDFLDRVRAGDPTPFKTFRQAEYLATVNRMGLANTEMTVEDRLSEEITLTQEVRAFALGGKKQGALIFGLSDKPDEASVPTEALELQGYLPVHKVKTGMVGAG